LILEKNLLLNFNLEDISLTRVHLRVSEELNLEIFVVSKDSVRVYNSEVDF